MNTERLYVIVKAIVLEINQNKILNILEKGGSTSNNIISQTK